ncbi:MAG: beta-propeller repeat protein [Proteobacteria bacterium]|nr:beta-propeller repeat protein [Pseudomonadota bacterium]
MLEQGSRGDTGLSCSRVMICARWWSASIGKPATAPETFMATRSQLITAIVAALVAVGASSQAVGREQLERPAGPSADGKTGITPNNWQITPAGEKLRVGHVPLGMILSPDGKDLLISNNGYGQHSLMRVDREALVIRDSIPYDSPEGLFIGLAITRDGKHIYASGGHSNMVRVYEAADAGITEKAAIQVDPRRKGGFVTGIALSADQNRLFVANHQGGDVAVIDPAARTVTHRIPMGVSADPYNASKFPYGVLPTADGKKLYVSNWKEGNVAVVDVENPDTAAVVKYIPAGQHPSAMLLSPAGDKLYVANANSDSISVIDTRADSRLFDVDVRPYKNAPSGSAPNALAMSPDGKTLYVLNAGENAVVVVALEDHEKGTGAPYVVKGRIPTGWYPTALSISPTGDKLYVANSKDVGLGQNAYPQTYIGDQMIGSLSVIDVPDKGTLKRYTRQVAENNMVARGKAVSAGEELGEGLAHSSVLRQLPIKHVVYVLKENRTYDQIFGDLPKGNGDPSLVMFDDRSAPNHRRLARDYVLLDNTYCDAEISKDGHERSMGGNATDYTMKVWPSDYSGRGTLINRALTAITNVPGGYLWDAAKEAGISYRSYGEYVINGKTLADGSYEPATTRMPALVGQFSPMYRTYDLKHMDVKRAEVWLKEFEAYKQSGEFPNLSIISLPNDHLAGTSPGFPTPQAMMADNDLALGRIVDAISHSRFWPNTLIMVIEDDTQDGFDHVDTHRTPALLIGPYVRRQAVDSTHYSTVSMIRTAEVLLGMKPMSQFDAAAVTMENSFTLKPDFTPYEHVVPAQDLYEMNPALASLQGEKRHLAERSMKLDLAEVDAADMREYNDILWKAIKGSEAPPARPLPQRLPGIREVLLVSQLDQ